MAKHHGPVLVDTNVIIECWRVSAWKALTGGYAVETVQMCEIETQEGLLGDVGYKPKVTLRPAYTRKWHTDTLTQLAMLEKKKP